MGSPEILDFATLLAPIPGDNPAGKALREDFSPRSVYQTVKAARVAARAAEKKILEGSADATDKADWKPILQAVPQVLANESKDLELVVWLIEGLIRVHGFAGLRDGFRLARGLVENFWDDLYPLPDEDGVITRVAPLAGLNGESGEGVLIGPIVNAPITEPGDLRGLSLADYRQAVDLAKIDDSEKRALRIEQGAVDQETFDKAARGTSTGFLRTLMEDVKASCDEYDQLNTLLETKCGKGPDGYPLAPPSSKVRGELMAVHERIESMLKGRADAAPAAESSATDASKEAVAASDAGRSDGASTVVRNRQEAVRSILRVAEYFKQAEPHSPIAYHLERVARWANLSLPELWTELIAEESQRNQLFNFVGIKVPQKN